MFLLRSKSRLALRDFANLWPSHEPTDSCHVSPFGATGY